MLVVHPTAMPAFVFGLILLLGPGLPGFTGGSPLSATPEPAPRLTAISFSRAATGNTRFVRLHLTGRVSTFSQPSEASDGGLEMRLYNVVPGDDLQTSAPQRSGWEYTTRTTRSHLIVSFRVSGSVTGDVFRDVESNDLIVALATSGPDGLAEAEARSILRSITAQEQPIPSAAQAPGSEETSVTGAALRWKIDRIAIDAGHGGKDPGAIGSGRVREKDLVLPIALKLGQYLEERLGVEVIYTRKSDTFIALRERGRVANREGADLFISIHANSAANRSAYGTETFFLGMNKGGPAQKVIERENSVIQLEQDQSHYDQFDQAALVRLQLAQSAFLHNSEELASRIEEQFSDRVGRRSRGVKEGNLQVLWAAAMPAVLVEVGFVSNASEARFLGSQQGVDYMASAIFRAVRDYKTAFEHSLSLDTID
ncbi:MAG: N-acetylmuramoyl-L-alanine amidase [Rhodothermales bacterium]|jgi:N-acetylmuramoyl-L-alanine amidase